MQFGIGQSVTRVEDQRFTMAQLRAEAEAEVAAAWTRSGSRLFPLMVVFYAVHCAFMTILLLKYRCDCDGIDVSQH